jgi:hypothetical protein
LRFINITLVCIGNVVDAAYSFPKIFFTRFKTIGEDEDEDEDEDDEDKVADIIRRLASGKYVCICTVCTRCMLYIILSAIFVSIFRPN